MWTIWHDGSANPCSQRFCGGTWCPIDHRSGHPSADPAASHRPSATIAATPKTLPRLIHATCGVPNIGELQIELCQVCCRGGRTAEG